MAIRDYLAGTALVATSVIFLPAEQAAAQSLCSEYTVVRGDTLSLIARSAGVAGGYQTLFSANQSILASPNLIEIGDKIAIPCADGSLPGQSVTAAAVPSADQKLKDIESVAAAPSGGFQPTIRFLTGSNYAPLTDEGLREGGMFTELVRQSMLRADAERDYSVIFVNDWGAHLTDLLPVGAFDLGFPWFRPDCERSENFSDATLKRCTDFDWSDPFFEAVVGYYVRANSPLEDAQDHMALKNTTICRPDGWYTFDLESEGLVEPDVTRLVPASQTACWEALMDGSADVVSLEVLPAEEDIARLGLEDSVVEVSALASVQTLHVLAPKTNPFGRTYLTLLNQGLREMRSSGEWFSIVSTQLREHEARKSAAN